jgi:hypothetical protein
MSKPMIREHNVTTDEVIDREMTDEEFAQYQMQKVKDVAREQAQAQAATDTSYNGWPASKDQAEIGVKSFKVKGTHLKLRCAEKVAPLLCGFASEFHHLIEPLDVGSLDDWGYAFRDVRGVPGKLSNHASGTAIDLNSSRHKLGQVGTFAKGEVPMLKALAKKYGLTWGGDWTRP